MKKTIILAFLIFQLSNVMACCGAGKYKVFPLGESNNRIVMVTFDLNRKCEKGKMFEEYHWNGVVSLTYFQGDTFELISVIDTIDFYQTNERDSVVNHLKQFYDSIVPFYQKALLQARNLKDFIESELIEYEYHKDTLPFHKISILNDTVLLVDSNEIKLFPLNWGACGYYNDINSIRVYKLNNKVLRVLSLSCYRHALISDEIIEFNTTHFKLIDEAYIVDKTEWHGENYDYILSQ